MMTVTRIILTAASGRNAFSLLSQVMVALAVIVVALFVRKPKMQPWWAIGLSSTIIAQAVDNLCMSRAVAIS